MRNYELGIDAKRSPYCLLPIAYCLILRPFVNSLYRNEYRQEC